MQTPQEKPLNLKDIAAILLKRKWLVIIPIIAVTGLAFASTYLMTPVYRSSTIIWIDQPSNVSRELGMILGREQEGRVSSEEQRRQVQALQNELTSQTYLFQLIKELGLDNDPEVTRQAAKMREANLSSSLDQLKLNLLVDDIRGRVEVSFVGKDQIELAVKSSDPVQAKDMVVSLAR
ncbi:MAG TPA: Wzz/FepE/Etk N-terminal domain-containing protein, partial [candidate division Zixibacteria bacterium]|nr:Wzz/FepE/Etk N-terminal domain-containing protein [candidate division Zixibacteria bacterium]